MAKQAKILLLQTAAVLAWMAAQPAGIAQQATSEFERFQDYSRRAQALLDVRPAEAIGLYREALKLRPAWVDGWLYMGAALYQTGRHAEATDALRKGIALAPGQGTAWALLGLAEAELDNTEQALVDIQKGQQLGLGANQQFELAVRIKAARLLIEQGSFDEAMGQFYPLSKRGVRSPAIEETMGLAVLGADTDLKAISPQRMEVVRLAGKAAWAGATQRPEEAVAGYKELIERFPKEPGVHNAHGLYLMESDMAGALEAFKTEIANTPTHWPAMLLLASLQIRQGSPEAAIETQKQAIKLVPQKYRWICHAGFGQAHLTMGQFDKAIPELEWAAKLVNGNAQIQYYLAQAYRRAGRREDAAKANAEFQRLKEIEDPLALPAYQPGAKR